MLSRVYRQEAFADYTLVLIPEETPEPINDSTEAYPDGCQALPVHGLLLADKSETFRLKFMTAVGRPANACKDDVAGTSTARAAEHVEAPAGASRPRIYMQVSGPHTHAICCNKLAG